MDPHIASQSRATAARSRARKHRANLIHIKSSKHKRRKAPFLRMIILEILTTLLVVLYSYLLVVAEPSIHVEQRCEQTDSFFCNIPNYVTVQPFHNDLGHTTQENAKASLHKFGFLLRLPECRKRVQLFLCSLFLPICVNSPDNTTQVLRPCRDICEKAHKCERQIRDALNTSWPSEWDCDKYQYNADNPLCVIDNREDNQPLIADVQQITDTRPLTSEPTSPLQSMNFSQTEEPICDSGFFDCRSSNRSRPYCIEEKLLCDGKRDCPDDSTYNDEVDCKDLVAKHNGCEEGQLNCDGKCIGKDYICNGMVDCSSGSDEQDCDDRAGNTQFIVCLILTSAAMICMMVRCIRRSSVDHKPEAKEQPHYETPCDTYIHRGVSLPSSEAEIIEDFIPQETYKHLPTTPLFAQPTLTLCQQHDNLITIYQEPSIVTRSDFDDQPCIGGYSDLSEYAYGTSTVSHKDQRRPTPPPVPPPTPSPDHEHIYTDEHIYINESGAGGPGLYHGPQQLLMVNGMANTFHHNHEHQGIFTSN